MPLFRKRPKIDDVVVAETNTKGHVVQHRYTAERMSDGRIYFTDDPVKQDEFLGSAFMVHNDTVRLLYEAPSILLSDQPAQVYSSVESEKVAKVIRKAVNKVLRDGVLSEKEAKSLNELSRTVIDCCDAEGFSPKSVATIRAKAHKLALN